MCIDKKENERIKKIDDEWGVIREADKILPDNKHRLLFLRSIAELEDNECHISRNFPISQLHKVDGIKNLSIYRAYIGKTSGWRIHLQYDKKSNYLKLKQVINRKRHDNCIDVINSHRHRYE